MQSIVRLGMCLSLVLAGSTASQAATTPSEVAALLAQSSSAWNRGDLDTFMKTYENSPQTQYISSTAVERGYAAIRARYAGTIGPVEWER